MNGWSASRPHLLVQRQHPFFTDVSFGQIDGCEQRKQRREPSVLIILQERSQLRRTRLQSLLLPSVHICWLVFIFYCSHDQNKHKPCVFAELLTIICVLSWPLLRGPEVRRLIRQEQNKGKGRTPRPCPETGTVLVLAGLVTSEPSKNVSVCYLFANN